MSILVDKNTKVVVQGLTGREGSFHAKQCLDYGTQIVAGVTPGKGGLIWKDSEGKYEVPVYNTVEEAVKETGANTSLIFVPPPFAADAIVEAATAGIKTIVCITEGIPVKDMMYVKDFLKQELSTSDVHNYIILFKDILKQDYPLRDVCRQIQRSMDLPSRIELVHILFGLANADNHIHMMY